MAFVCELYREQLSQGRYFLHEHPQSASSWQLECVQEVWEWPGVDCTVCDQCQYGHEDGDGNPVKKGTRWMSNSPETLEQLSRRCHGALPQCSGAKGGQHMQVSGRLSREAAVYPLALCKAILVGCRNQLRRDGRLILGVVGMQPDPLQDCSDRALARRVARLYSLDVEGEIEKMQHEELRPAEGASSGIEVVYVNVVTGAVVPPEVAEGARKEFEELDYAGGRSGERPEVFVDAVTGQPLQPELVKAARRKELEYFYTKGVWTKRALEEARRRMGKPAISVRWIDANTGDDECPNYRSRLVARDPPQGRRPDLRAHPAAREPENGALLCGYGPAGRAGARQDPDQ